QANGLVERANATIVASLKKVVQTKPDSWDEQLPNIVLALNTAQQSTTKHSPFYLLHGYIPRLPRQLRIGTRGDDKDRIDQLDLLAEIRGKATANIEESHNQSK